MSLRDVVIDLAVVAAVASTGFGLGNGHGYARGVAAMNPKVLAAQQAQANAQRQASQDTQALVQVQTQLNAQKAALEQASARAAQALEARQTLATQLAAATRQRLNDDRKTLHENDCMALERVPVCPQLAHRLFGQPAAPSAADAALGH